MKYSPINFKDKLAKFSEHWSPKVISQLNNYQFKLAKIKGEFVWHEHQKTDEAFIVIDGEMFIEFEDGKVKLKEGELFVVPKGKKHKPCAENECKILIIEPEGVVNTGENKGTLTSENDVWI